MIEREREEDREKADGSSDNVAPDAVKDPNAKTEGKPGLGPQGGRPQGDETDPGSS